MRTMKKLAGKRMIAYILTLILLISAFPLVMPSSVQAATPHTRVVDASTMDDWQDYFGEKVVGRNAIAKIINAWENEKKQFTIDKKKNKLIYTYPEGANTYELRYICDELPPKLNAKVASRSLVMDLDMAIEFFGVKFGKTIFGVR